MQADKRPRPRKGDGSNVPGAAKKRKSGGSGRPSMRSTDGQSGKRKQSSLRESWGASARRDGRNAHDDEDQDDEHEAGRPRKPGRAADASGRSAQGGGGIIGRRGVPQPNQPGSFGQDRRRISQVRQQEDQESSERASSGPPSPPKPYVHVAPHTRRVRQSAIESKWSPLANASATAVSTTLQLAQRPILQRLSDSQLRRTHTSSALHLITHRISRKISRGLPFPPASMPANVGRAPLQSDGGREVELNFEAVLDGKLNLERQLEPALDGLEVLQREKETLEEELEQDYETLRNLEAGARAQAREQRSLLKKAHVLTPAPPKLEGEAAKDEQKNEDGFHFARDGETALGSAFTDINNHDDNDIQPLVVQLGDHVDNIRANLEQTDKIMPQLARSRAALRAVLLRHLDLRRYEEAVLG
ncbi:hypothetical protein QQS21_005913 [Conoideocrella luteorostrata]|uniref:Kinetochore protein fta7 n=1 Tax=Conoideocrella luteorostrata TaxID=1105319 RepID=A0AAJ0FYR5_9HYPO|nr:hypothetical protein QQS21_005913 [Conoideocrella luteorostrata]